MTASWEPIQGWKSKHYQLLGKTLVEPLPKYLPRSTGGSGDKTRMKAVGVRKRWVNLSRGLPERECRCLQQREGRPRTACFDILCGITKKKKSNLAQLRRFRFLQFSS